MPVSKISSVGIERLEGRRRAMDGPVLGIGELLAVVDGLAQHVDEAAERPLADGHRHGCAGVHDLHAAGEPVRGVHGDGPHPVVAEMLLHLGHELACVAVVVDA